MFTFLFFLITPSIKRVLLNSVPHRVKVATNEFITYVDGESMGPTYGISKSQATPYTTFSTFIVVVVRLHFSELRSGPGPSGKIWPAARA